MPGRVGNPKNPNIAKVTEDAKITKEEVVELGEQVKKGWVSRADVEKMAKENRDLFGAGAGSEVARLGKKLGANIALAPPMRSLGDSAPAAAVMRGEKQLSKTQNAKDPAVLQYQRALDAVANRTGHPELALKASDGAFGPDTVRAVKAFQKSQNLPETGVIDGRTAMKLEYELYTHAPPDTGAVAAGPKRPDGDKIAQAALDLISKRGADYGTAATWKSPNPLAHGNRNPGVTELGAKDRWKCNIFGLDSVYAGGGKPPMYESGWYPIAIEIPNYSRGPNPPLVKMGEVWTNKGTPDEVKAKIDELMRVARPGDLVIVNHPGNETADGGHTRVVVANHFDEDGTIEFAQASVSAAMVKREQVSSFTGEEAVYLLRPNQAR